RCESHPAPTPSTKAEPYLPEKHRCSSVHPEASHFLPSLLPHGYKSGSVLRYLPVPVSFWWMGGKSVSTIEEVVLDSTSESLDDSRKKEIWLTLESGATFDKQKEYALVMRDIETDKEHKRITVTIDRSFEDDF
ncbi:hypothetical protein OAN47_04440, partial [Planctomycetota bacterium]|nr:hypothetical protein [Planctomycetota bacterium]